MKRLNLYSSLLLILGLSSALFAQWGDDVRAFAADLCRDPSALSQLLRGKRRWSERAQPMIPSNKRGR